MIPTESVENDSLDVFTAVILPLARPFEAFLNALIGKRDAEAR